MANTGHEALTGTDLHEPKGVAAATADKVYVANGSGSGVWEKITAASIDTTVINNLNKLILNIELDDLSTAESHFVVCPLAGDIVSIFCVIDTAIATADTTLAFEIAGTVVTGGGITIAYSGSAAGDVDSSTPSAAKTLTAGQPIEVIVGGETNTSNAHAHLSIVIDVT